MSSRAIYCGLCGHNLRREGYRGMRLCLGWNRIPEVSIGAFQTSDGGLAQYASAPTSDRNMRFNSPAMRSDGTSCTQAQEWLLKALREHQERKVDRAAEQLLAEMLIAATMRACQPSPSPAPNGPPTSSTNC